MKVNGKPVDRTVRVESKMAATAARDVCVSLPRKLRAGCASSVWVQAVEFGIGRPMSGTEGVVVRVVAPSGVSASLPLEFDKKTARFQVRVHSGISGRTTRPQALRRVPRLVGPNE